VVGWGVGLWDGEGEGEGDLGGFWGFGFGGVNFLWGVL
jgi:hypothetical protein